MGSPNRGSDDITSLVMRTVGFEPTIPEQDGGFKDRCVFQFHHVRVRECSRLGLNQRPRGYESGALSN